MKNPEDNLIKIGIEEGNQIFYKILEDFPKIDSDDPRLCSVLLSLMTNCVVQLHLHGYSEKELVNEVFDWCEIARNLFDKEDEE